MEKRRNSLTKKLRIRIFFYRGLFERDNISIAPDLIDRSYHLREKLFVDARRHCLIDKETRDGDNDLHRRCEVFGGERVAQQIFIFFESLLLLLLCCCCCCCCCCVVVLVVVLLAVVLVVVSAVQLCVQ